MRIWRLYYYPHVLSIDVAVGAVVGALFFARIFDVVLYPQGLLVLGLTVWAIYAADHLLDAWRLAGPAISQRHRFYQLHFQAILVVLGLVVLAILVLLPFIRTALVVNGVYFSLAVLGYLLMSPRLYYLKEVLAGLLYAGGVLLPALSLSTDPFDLARGLVAAQFLVVVWMNLLLFARMDYSIDRADRQQSIVTLAGRSSAKVVVIGLLLLLLGLNALMEGQYIHQRLVISGMGLLLAALVWQEHPDRHLRYRMLGDAVFFLPACVL